MDRGADQGYLLSQRQALFWVYEPSSALIIEFSAERKALSFYTTLGKYDSSMREILQQAPIVPIFYDADAEYARQALQACYDGGLRTFEFTKRGPAAFEVFAALRAYSKRCCPGLLLGIGTLFDPVDASRFIQSGADFIVQPVCTPAIGALCLEAGIPWVPGALTPGEIWTAWEGGASIVKIFPGNAIGPDYIRALRGPMPDLPLMVTGGVAPEARAIRSWLSAGALAVGIGAQLFKGHQPGNQAALSAFIARLVSDINI
jgi:2-dehydro-3-deoxyphosphogluconate aldolase/(4S)-4-hydroxy-2-oxoglutarate aldolase